MIKQLSSFLAIGVSGGDRLSYTYDEIDENTGDLISANKKESFFVVNADLKDHIEAIRTFIRENKLTEE